MPIYDYECTECGVHTQVIRNLAESDVGPEPEENRGNCQHKWVKVHLGAPQIIKGANWGSGKGRW